MVMRRATKRNSAATHAGDARPNLTTLGGRIQHVRFSLYGSVSRVKFGRLVAEYERTLNPRAPEAYYSSTVADWEEKGAVPGLYATIAIAAIGGFRFDWLVKHEGPERETDPQPAPTPQADARPTVDVPGPDRLVSTPRTTTRRRRGGDG